MHKPSRVEVAGPLAAYAIGFRLESTQVYLHADLRSRRKALARTTPPETAPGRYRPPDTLLAFLEAL